MREIKFRAWASDEPYMLSWRELMDMQSDLVSLDGDYSFFKDDSILLMQYTGLKDKNGVELDWWEGDILMLDGGQSGIFPITWDDYGACFMCGEDLLVNVANDCFAEKIGTLHENPELLGESK